MSKRIVVTGAAGFLGSHLVKELISEGNRVIGIDNFLTGKAGNLAQINNKHFIFLNLDVCSGDLQDHPLLNAVDEIYHLASPASPKSYQANPIKTVMVNTLGTENMLKLAKKHDAKVVYTSTSEVYGDPKETPQTETYRGNVNTWGPRACYDESKRLGEVLCYLYNTLYGVKVKVARIFNTYSAGLANDDGRVISNFVTEALTGKDITVHGDGTQTRSFCYVSDTIRGLRQLMETDEATGQIINIGSPDEITILDLAKKIKSLTNSRSKIAFQPLPLDDPLTRRPDITKAGVILNWSPTVSLEKGLKATIQAYQNKL
ncbi:NAD-dependent epimerase/dehydratase family protein [Sporolactobacillus vineae]|uniref:NAD-dependent epimerase/dehydratase family protein n=1 Tax=Sporolactobacillus vineae TaxID=444463 RepID=UPI0002898E20|nr:NAD-dependent epimerase/dehydratase family protein [Sporolactobacillus vineae]